MADNVDHTHGDSGDKPPQDLDFQSGGLPDAQEFDWFWNQVPAAINDHANLLESIDSDEDGAVDRADVADSAETYKGNDIDTDGDGKVNSADTADAVKGNDIDANGDGRVDAADTAAKVKGNDIDSNGDGKVNAADAADTAAKVKGNDIDSNGDGRVDAADTAAKVKGNDIDSNGDGTVDEADSANAYKGNDIDSNGDGKVDSAVTADDADNVTSTYKGNDIDSNGDGTVDAADEAPWGGLTGKPTDTGSYQSVETEFAYVVDWGGGTTTLKRNIFAYVTEVRLSAGPDTTAKIIYADGTTDSVSGNTVTKTVNKYAVQGVVNSNSDPGSVEVKVRPVASHSHTLP